MNGNRANHIAVALRALILGLFAALGIMVIGATSANADDGDLLGSLAEQVAEPLGKQVAAPVIEKSSSALTEPALEKAVVPVTDAVIQPVTKQVAAPVVQHVAKPIVNQVAAPILDPVVERVAKPVVEKVVGPVVNTAVEPVKSTLQPVTDSVQSTLDPISDTAGNTLDPVTEPAVEHVVDPIVDLEKQVKESIGESAATPHSSSHPTPVANVVDHVAEADSANPNNPALPVQERDADARTTSNHKTTDVTDSTPEVTGSTQPSGGVNVTGPVHLASIINEASPADTSVFGSAADASALVLPSAGMSNAQDAGVKSTGGNFDVASPGGAPAPAGSATSSAGNASATAYLTDHYLLPHQLVGGQQHHGSWALPSSTFSDPGFSPD